MAVRNYEQLGQTYKWERATREELMALLGQLPDGADPDVVSELKLLVADPELDFATYVQTAGGEQRGTLMRINNALKEVRERKL